MIIRKYGITLKRLKEEDIELVRQMRNSEGISRTMFYRNHITPEMQLKWFNSINNKNNGYYIIIHEDKKIGMIHGKNIDFEKRTCEGGIFIWDPSYIGTIIPSLASVIMNDWTFYIMNFNAIYAKVLADNQTALNYNILMGYKLCDPVNNDIGVQWLVLTKEKYFARMKSFRKNMVHYTKDAELISIKDIDASDDSASDIELFYKGLPPDIQEQANAILAKSGLK
ncbi:MAG TPA: GNAT family N-acetyltransferase [Bacteroidia bacterium]|nr:GNAT family N-acetyltransferase [Bacteroidia bacterium]